jgi:hypothetical protein
MEPLPDWDGTVMEDGGVPVLERRGVIAWAMVVGLTAYYGG